MQARTTTCLGLMLALSGGCSGEREATFRAGVTVGLKRELLASVDVWATEVAALASAAPTPLGRGWSRTEDAAAIIAMKNAWARARHAYERVEGALAPIFPESDTATDARYDDHLATLGPAGDPDPFDEAGVIGMHAIERILWADAIPGPVVAFERGLPGYRPAAMPASEAEARAFKEKLAARLVADVRKVRTDLAALELDQAFAFRGLVDLVAEQVEKVDKTASGEEESRYASATMRDLRANLQGAADAYELYRPWLLSKRGGTGLDERVHAAFRRLSTAYAAVRGDAIPTPPTTWRATGPSAEDLASPFGRLQAAVKRECDERVDGSLLSTLGEVARLLDLPEVLR